MKDLQELAEQNKKLEVLMEQMMSKITIEPMQQLREIKRMLDSKEITQEQASEMIKKLSEKY